MAQLRLEAVKKLLEVLGVILLLWNQLEPLLFSGLDTQLQVSEAMLDAGQGLLDALRPSEVHNGKDALGTHSHRHIYRSMKRMKQCEFSCTASHKLSPKRSLKTASLTLPSIKTAKL